MNSLESVAIKIRRHGGPGQWNLQATLSVALSLRLDGNEVVNMSGENLGVHLAKQVGSMTLRDMATCIDDVTLVERPQPSLPDLESVKVDSTTVAYLAIGAARYCDNRRREGKPVTWRDGGEVEFMAAVTGSPAVRYVEWLFDKHSDEWSGVFAYDVAEPLGAALAEALMDGASVSDQEACRLAEKIFDDALSITESSPPDIQSMEGPARACLFFEELLASVETVSGIAEKHGENALVTLIYLQGAIANGGQIEALSDDPIHLIVGTLPNAHEWVNHIQVV